MDLINVQTFPQVVAYLRDEMDWPIERADFQEEDELFFSYKPYEFGIDDRNAAKIESIRRLRPLSVHQPWGVFFVKFEPKRLPVGAMRRILSGVTEKKRASANPDDRAVWSPNDLLFASSYGEGDDRKLNFAHFASNEDRNDLPTLKVIEWDSKDSLQHREHVAQQLTTKLSWPENTKDKSKWSEQWSSAFTLKHREVITTSKELAVELAKLAQEIRKKINDVLEIETEDGPVSQMMATVKKALVHDLDNDGFADMYAQTIAYGLLSARITNPTDVIADDLVAAMPVTNPFLKELMETFMKVGGRKGTAATGGLDFDELGVSEVVELLRKANMEAVLRDFGDKNQQEDPVIHFFEGFLQEYDKKIRKDRGVFYTPRPVVSFIVRSVDELLRTEFGLEDGLADTTTWGEISERIDDLKIPEGTTTEQDFVQILDPATGTGTFLVEVIDLVHKTMTQKWQSEGRGAREIEKLWNDYVPKHLLPRLHGYELMMAPYAIAHMKIGLKLFETGYRFESDERARVYLTNALEPAQDYSGTFEFAIPALAHEAQAVNAIKRDQRFTVVIGNPPYSINSSNMGDWIVDLCEEYKRTIRHEETQIQAVSDDYVKFMRLSHWHAVQTGYCVIGLITNNGYLRGLLFRDMRHSLMSTFKAIYCVDLCGGIRPGSSRRSSENDQNIFDIQTAVAISFMLHKFTPPKTGERSVSLHEMVGDRESKYRALGANMVYDLSQTSVLPSAPLFPFAVVSQDLLAEFRNAPSILEFFGSGIEANDRHKRYGAGFVSQQDDFAIGFERGDVSKRVRELLSEDMTEAELRQRYRMCSTSQWSFDRARSELPDTAWEEQETRILYRPFDFRWTVLNRNVVSILRRRVMSQLQRDNLAICVGRQGQATGGDRWNLIFCTSRPEDYNLFARGNNLCLPLVHYQIEDEGVGTLFSRNDGAVSSNLNGRLLDLWRDEGLLSSSSASSEDRELFFYIYGLLHSDSYRERYHDFLAMEFPRILRPQSRSLRVGLSELGQQLVSLHVMGEASFDYHMTTVEGSGHFQVEKVSYSDEVVWIDKAMTRGFRGVSEAVWNFHIGGYQVCAKWLKDRQAKGGKNPRPARILTDDDIAHYQKIVVALSETIRIMGEIDEVIEEHGGWPGAFQTD